MVKFVSRRLVKVYNKIILGHGETLHSHETEVIIINKKQYEKNTAFTMCFLIGVNILKQLKQLTSTQGW